MNPWSWVRRQARVSAQTAAEHGQEHFGLTLLVMPEAKRRWRRRDEDEEPVEDSYDRFLSRERKPY